MSGNDLYTSSEFGFGSWSDTVAYTPAAGGAPATVQVGGFAASTVTLEGSIAQAGDAVTLTIQTGGQPVQEQLQAVCDIQGGSVFTDLAGDTYLFSDGGLTQGATYDAVPGFGHFADGPPQPACFAAGTRIETRRGPLPVEALRPGDEVRAVLRASRGGGWAPVIWTGWRQVGCAGHPAPAEVWPVRVAAGAFGPGRPQRDLFLSPDHAVFDRGALVPIRYLVNDATITQSPVAAVTYWHVELPAHDILLAEGLETESFLDTGNRAAFVGGGPASTLDPLAQADRARRIWDERACGRLLLHPAEHAGLRRQLRARAVALGWRETTDAALRLHAGEAASSSPLPPEWCGRMAIGTVPPGAAALRLCSRSAVPCRGDTANPDARRLGVAVTAIILDGRPVRLDDMRLQRGWHRMEDGWRWTDGDALIPLTPAASERRIQITTAPMLTYWQRPDTGLRAAA